MWSLYVLQCLKKILLSENMYVRFQELEIVGVNANANGCLSLWSRLHCLASVPLWVFTLSCNTLIKVTILFPPSLRDQAVT